MYRKSVKLTGVLLVCLLALALTCGCSSSSNPGSSGSASASSGASASEPGSSSEEASSSESASAAPSESSSESSAVPTPLIGSFTTATLDGETVTESILAEKDYTMINVWGTYCGPCINEMPELEKLHKELPENMQMIGVICDLAYGFETDAVKDAANEIIEETGVTYPSLLFWPEASWFPETSNVVPTTYFVDSKGNLVSDIIYGAHIDAYRAAIEKLSS